MRYSTHFRARYCVSTLGWLPVPLSLSLSLGFWIQLFTNLLASSLSLQAIHGFPQGLICICIIFVLGLVLPIRLSQLLYIHQQVSIYYCWVLFRDDLKKNMSSNVFFQRLNHIFTLNLCSDGTSLYMHLQISVLFTWVWQAITKKNTLCITNYNYS